MVFGHGILDYVAGHTSLERVPFLGEVKESLLKFHNEINRDLLKQRYDPWNFEPESQAPFVSISNEILLPLQKQFLDNQTNDNLGDLLAACEYYEQLLIPSQERLPPEIFAYAEENFGSMPPRSEEGGSVKIVDSKDMKRLFPQYAAGMEHFCSIIDKYYGREPYEDRYNRCVSQESRDLVAAHMAEHEQEILTIFQETAIRVEEARSSLGPAKTLEPISRERIEALYKLCVAVDEHIKQQTGQYLHEMTLEEIRKLPMDFLSEIREKFPYTHDDKPSSAGGADDPELVFACLLADREAYRG